MRYENSVQKKLRSLFEYLDVDGDGKITQNCLLNGLARLRNHKIIPENKNKSKSKNNNSTKGESNLAEEKVHLSDIFSEYSIEELIRSVPHADEQGGITLQAFLDAEATLLPHLTNLKLLQ